MAMPLHAKGLTSSVDEFIGRVWDPTIVMEMTRLARQQATWYPSTWVAKAAICADAGAPDDSDDDDDGAAMPSFLMVDLMVPSPTGCPDPELMAVNDDARDEVAFVADAWGRTMEKTSILQITRIQSKFLYKRFDHLKEVMTVWAR